MSIKTDTLVNGVLIVCTLVLTFGLGMKAQKKITPEEQGMFDLSQLQFIPMGDVKEDMVIKGFRDHE